MISEYTFQDIGSVSNKYIDTFIDSYVKSFRSFITSKYTVRVGGLAGFIATDDHDVLLLTNKLQRYGFEVMIYNGQDTVVRNQKAPLLLGQSVLDRLGSIEIDSRNQKLEFTSF